MIIIIWVILCFAVAFTGKDKKIGYGGVLIFSLLLSPLIGLIIGLASSPKLPKKIIRCDGCRQEIKGKYIVIRPKGSQDKFDYCSKECRNEYHPKYMSEKGIEWTPPIEE